MKTKIVIKGHKLRRDIAANLVLKRVLEREGFKVFLTNQENHKYILKFWRPHIVVEETTAINETRKILPNSSFVLLHSEGAMFENFSPILQEVKKYDAVFCWGKEIYNGLYNTIECKGLFNENRVVVTGNPRMDLIKYALPLVDGSVYKTVGIMSSIKALKRVDYPELLKLIYKVGHERQIKSVSADAETYKIYFEIIENVIQNTSFSISYRPHPNEQMNALQFLVERYNGRFQIDKSIDLANWVKKQKVIVSTASSSYIEAYLAKVPCINVDKLLNINMEKVAFDNQKLSYKVALFPGSMTEVLALIKEPPKVSRNDRIEEVLEDIFNYYQTPSSIVRVSDNIVNIAKNCVKSDHTGMFFSGRYILSCCLSLLIFVVSNVRNKYSKEYSYNCLYHKTPKYLIKLADELFSKHKIKQ